MRIPSADSDLTIYRVYCASGAGKGERNRYRLAHRRYGDGKRDHRLGELDRADARRAAARQRPIPADISEHGREQRQVPDGIAANSRSAKRSTSPGVLAQEMSECTKPPRSTVPHSRSAVHLEGPLYGVRTATLFALA